MKIFKYFTGKVHISARSYVGHSDFFGVRPCIDQLDVERSLLHWNVIISRLLVSPCGSPDSSWQGKLKRNWQLGYYSKTLRRNLCSYSQNLSRPVRNLLIEHGTDLYLISVDSKEQEVFPSEQGWPEVVKIGGLTFFRTRASVNFSHSLKCGNFSRSENF